MTHLHTARGALAAITPIESRLSDYETRLRDLTNKFTLRVMLDVRRSVRQAASQSSLSTTSSSLSTPSRGSGSLAPVIEDEVTTSDEAQCLTSSPDHDSDVFDPPRNARPRPETRVTIPLLHLTPAPEHDQPSTQREAAVPLDRSASIASLRQTFPDVDDEIMCVTPQLLPDNWLMLTSHNLQ